jgi:hypothetical protein
MQRHAKLNLTLQVDEPGKDVVGTVGNPMHRPKRGDLGDGLSTECQPFLAQPEDQDADCLSMQLDLILVAAVAFPDSFPGRDRQPSGPIGQVTLGGGPVEEGGRCCRKDRTIAAMDECLQLGTASVAGDADVVPAVAVSRHAAMNRYANRKTIPGGGIGRGAGHRHFNSLASWSSRWFARRGGESRPRRSSRHGARPREPAPEAPRHV